MKIIIIFYLYIFIFLVVKFSVYLNRHVFVMNRMANSVGPDETAHDELSHLDLQFAEVFGLVCSPTHTKCFILVIGLKTNECMYIVLLWNISCLKSSSYFYFLL